MQSKTEVRTIKGIDRKTWKKLKEISEKDKSTMGEAFSLIMNSYEESREKFWDKIFSIKKILSGNEADELNSLIYKERKKQGFRI